MDLNEFFSMIKSETSVKASANGSYQQLAFLDLITSDLIDIGDIQAFNDCNNPSYNGAHIHGFDIEDNEESDSVRIDLFITDYEQRDGLERIGKTDVDLYFKRLLKFFTESLNNELYQKIDESNSAYRIAEYIEDYKENIDEVNLFFISERATSEKFKDFLRIEIDGINIKYHFWDISRWANLRNASKSREAIEIDFVDRYDSALACLDASNLTEKMRSYLVVVPGGVLADLYNDHGARLLEQNVRSFLQAKGGVNKGIRRTILDQPEYFFAYNNGITATASSVEVEDIGGVLKITKLVDLQIVNGGQTTVSLARAKLKDGADLSRIYVQMKLSIINSDLTDEDLVAKISQYANTQNKVNASDLSANHPYHVKLEELSRRIWAPVVQATAYRQTQWFYERSRGQYNEMLQKDTRLNKIKYPKSQLFNKTDLAKYMMVWDFNEPKWVNMGAQKNFVKFTEEILKNWKKKEFQNSINEDYYKKVIARAIIFKRTERIVQTQPWYTNGYRANIVIYALAFVAWHLKRNKKEINYQQIWKNHEISQAFESMLITLSKAVNDILLNTDHPSRTTSNISEWAKKDGCWAQITGSYKDALESCISEQFKKELLDLEDVEKAASERGVLEKRNQDIQLVEKINSYGKTFWFGFLEYCQSRVNLSRIEEGVLQTASRQARDLSLKQCIILSGLIEKYEQDYLKYSKNQSIFNS